MRPSKGFKVKGCIDKVSRICKTIARKEPDWTEECIIHSLHYWIGGSACDRRCADMLMYRGVVNTGHPILALIIYTSVRFLGCPAFQFGLQWGHGHKNNRYFRQYYDRHHDVYDLLREECVKLNIKSTNLYGECNDG